MFNQQELMALLKICDAGTRAGGLEIAEFAVPLARKIRSLIQQQNATQQGNVVPMAADNG